MGKHRYTAQVLFVAFTTMVLTYMTIVLDCRSGWNALWMLLLPVALGFTFNRDFGRGAFMALALPIIALITVVGMGVVMGGH